MSFKIASFFAGAGGLDLGFEQAGFDIAYSNEFDKKITPTLKKNFTHSQVDDRDINKVSKDDIPNVDGIIGGPPCQSWSIAGKGRGLDDSRGQSFLKYIQLIKELKPKFFLAENVKGMLNSRNKESFQFLMSELESVGYNFSYKLMNVADYGVPQTRERVIFVGFSKDINQNFIFPEPTHNYQSGHFIPLKEAIWDLKDTALPAKEKNLTNGEMCKVLNHEYMIGSFSTIFMSRNRVRSWDEPSFTIQAGGRHAPIHPQAPKMLKVNTDQFKFDEKEGVKNSLYRRLSVREIARIQTFPDDFEFIYENLTSAYTMIGNAVPVDFASFIAQKIRKELEK